MTSIGEVRPNGGDAVERQELLDPAGHRLFRSEPTWPIPVFHDLALAEPFA